MQQQSHKRNLILASSSPYRKILLERLGIPFDVYSPDIDETARENENAALLVSRLAKSKAAVVASRFPGAVVIGSDQVAVLDNTIVGKPGDAEAAVEQLQRFSGRTVRFLTSFCVLCSDPAFDHGRTIHTDVCFRKLCTDEIQRYIGMDQPLNCAGSFKSEAAGISLLNAMNSEDPTAIIGLPLITLSDALRKAGFQVP